MSQSFLLWTFYYSFFFGFCCFFSSFAKDFDFDKISPFKVYYIKHNGSYLASHNEDQTVRLERRGSGYYKLNKKWMIFPFDTIENNPRHYYISNVFNNNDTFTGNVFIFSENVHKNPWKNQTMYTIKKVSDGSDDVPCLTNSSECKPHNLCFMQCNDADNQYFKFSILTRERNNA